ncbi:MAG: glycosyltransferase family 39 protein [Planctomycetaceae bacterium]|nr:glycosyltransferase family 39 protein [Planctomycetaceae bacterium]
MESDVRQADLRLGDSFSPLLVALAVAVALVIFVLPLGIGFPLLDPDEGLHAEIAREMAETGDWVTPRFLGKPFFDKPVLYFWAQAASLRVFGMSEAAVRLPGLMFGLLGAVTTGLLATRMIGRRAGLIGGTFYATTILPTALAQAASHDVALVPWINLSVLLLWESHRAANWRAVAGCILGAGFFIGLSLLAKGLEGAAVVGVAYGGWLIVTRRIDWRVLVRGLGVLLLAAMVAAPWYLAMERRHPGYLDYFFVNRHLLGFATATQPHANQPWWYYVPILLGGGLPWIGYLPGVWGKMRGKKVTLTSPLSPLLLLWCWGIGWPVVMTLARSKLATYVWPAFPPLAILAAFAWTRMVEGRLSEPARRAFARTFVGSCWSGPILLPVTVAVVQRLFGVPFSWQVWVATGVAAVLAPGPLVSWHMARKADGGGAALHLTQPTITRTTFWREVTVAGAALSLALQFLVAMTMVLPPVAECFSARELAAHFNREGRLPPRLWLAEQRLASLAFYLEGPLRAELKSDRIRPLKADRQERIEAGDVVAVPRADRYHAIPRIDFSDASCEELQRYRLYTARSPLVVGGEAKK